MTDSNTGRFKSRLLSGERLLGTFVKTPSPVITEVLGLTELDAVCLDAEHASFGRVELDSCVQTLRAADMPSLVRVAGNSREQILQALDCGATGIVVPHVTTVRQAAGIVKATHFGEGGRGYAGSTRAAGFTTKPMAAHLADSNRETTVIVQIEDPEAVDAVDEICTVDGIDCLFIGRIDLTVAFNANSPNDDIVIKAIQKVCAAGHGAGKSVGMFVPDISEAGRWVERGASLFLLASDHNFLLDGAAVMVDKFAGLKKQPPAD